MQTAETNPCVDRDIYAFGTSCDDRQAWSRPTREAFVCSSRNLLSTNLCWCEALAQRRGISLEQRSRRQIRSLKVAAGCKLLAGPSTSRAGSRWYFEGYTYTGLSYVNAWAPRPESNFPCQEGSDDETAAAVQTRDITQREAGYFRTGFTRRSFPLASRASENGDRKEAEQGRGRRAFR